MPPTFLNPEPLPDRQAVIPKSVPAHLNIVMNFSPTTAFTTVASVPLPAGGRSTMMAIGPFTMTSFTIKTACDMIQLVLLPI